MRVVDMYPMVQSEGHQYGAVQFMVRTAGCAVECPIRDMCDEIEALDFGAGKDIEPAEIVKAATRAVGHHGWIHISGGEPCNQPKALILLQQEAYRANMKVHLQTSGTIKVPIKWDWLTVSPKVPAKQLAQKFGQELKVIYDPRHIDLNSLAEYYYQTRFSDYYLQPLWENGKCNSDEVFEMLIYLNRNQLPWKMSVQWHKWLGMK
jgi:organic radical activating enzyme